MKKSTIAILFISAALQTMVPGLLRADAGTDTLTDIATPDMTASGEIAGPIVPFSGEKCRNMGKNGVFCAGKLYVAKKDSELFKGIEAFLAKSGFLPMKSDGKFANGKVLTIVGRAQVPDSSGVISHMGVRFVKFEIPLSQREQRDLIIKMSLHYFSYHSKHAIPEVLSAYGVSANGHIHGEAKPVVAVFNDGRALMPNGDFVDLAISDK